MENMTPEGFKAWRARMTARTGTGYSQAAAARDLGITPRMVKMYEAGQHPSRRDDDGEPLPVTIPRAVALACAALEAGLVAE